MLHLGCVVIMWAMSLPAWLPPCLPCLLADFAMQSDAFRTPKRCVVPLQIGWCSMVAVFLHLHAHGERKVWAASVFS